MDFRIWSVPLFRCVNVVIDVMISYDRGALETIVDTFFDVGMLHTLNWC